MGGSVFTPQTGIYQSQDSPLSAPLNRHEIACAVGHSAKVRPFPEIGKNFGLRLGGEELSGYLPEGDQMPLVRFLVEVVEFSLGIWCALAHNDLTRNREPKNSIISLQEPTNPSRINYRWLYD